MARYSAQIRNTILKKLLPPENRTAASLAREYNISVTTIYGWKAKMKHGTLHGEDGVLSNRERSLAEKLMVLLESRTIDDGRMGQWLREQGLHSQHLIVWEQEVKDAFKNKRTGIYFLTFLPKSAIVYPSGGSHDQTKKQLCFP